MTASRIADVVIVGLGAAGGIAAEVLTAAGVDVVAFEAGPRLRADDMGFDELHTDWRHWMAQPKAAREVPTWREDESQTSEPSPWPMLMANGVGGSSVHYEAASLRLQPWHFRERTETISRYGAGAIPARSTIADWPLSFEELEPHYTYVERAIGVSGQACRVGAETNIVGNHFEGMRSEHYPLPPLRRAGWSELMSDAARSLGWHPFPAPAAINSEPHDGRPACTYCGFCYNNGCYADAKGSTSATSIRRAEASGHLTVLTDSRVVGLDVNRDGLASAVRYVRNGREERQPARVVLLASYTYENIRLLLMSRSPAFPNGLANNHGQVGRNFMVHVQPFAFGLFPERRLNIFNGTMAQATCVDDWNADNFDHDSLGFVGGGMLACWAELKPIAVAEGMMLPPHLPQWGTRWKQWLARNAQSIGAAAGQFDSLPYDDSFLDLDPVVRDPLGLPVVRITHRVHDNERAGAAFLVEKLRAWLTAAGASETWAPHEGVVPEGRHAYGGTRMGLDPNSSVVDAYGFAHEVPNLGILGASNFPSAGGVNPTLTVQALAARTADRLVGSWSSAGTGA